MASGQVGLADVPARSESIRDTRVIPEEFENAGRYSWCGDDVSN